MYELPDEPIFTFSPVKTGVALALETEDDTMF
jgi:hypothetical protein